MPELIPPAGRSCTAVKVPEGSATQGRRKDNALMLLLVLGEKSPERLLINLSFVCHVEDTSVLHNIDISTYSELPKTASDSRNIQQVPC
jgi:hypothetical protein